MNVKNKITIHKKYLFIFFAGIFSIAFISPGCKAKRKIAATQTDTTQTNGNCKIDRKLPRPLIADMEKNEFHFDWFSAKLACDAGDDSSKVSLDISLRMKHDSLIWMNVTTAGLPIKIARALITKDSVKFVQYQDGTLNAQPKCFAGDFAFLSQLLGTDIDFDMLQSLLVGNSVSFYEEDEKLHSSINGQDCNYTLSTIRKRKLKKVLQGTRTLDEPLQTISLDPSTFKILKILFVDAQNRTFTANYSNFEKQDSVLLPRKAVFFARGLKRSVTLDVTYKKVNVNQPLDFPFSFPDDCTPIIIPQQNPGNVPGNGH